MHDQPANRTADRITTIERFILEEQRTVSPAAQGILTNLLYDIALAAKFIAARTAQPSSPKVTNRLNDVQSPSSNSHGMVDEDSLSLNHYAERIIQRLNDHTGRLAVMSSEEQPHIIPIPERYETGKYVLIYDPLDGVTNINFNVSIGTIFAIYERKSKEGRGTLEDCLRKGSELVAAGYIIYGSSTMMVYSTGQGVHGFTLDPHIGEFLLSHPNIQYPEKPRYYSANHAYQPFWDNSVRTYVEWLRSGEDKSSLKLRYIGSLVADFHRNLLAGGVFCYPKDSRDTDAWPDGRIHLLYEAGPLAFLSQQAGGYASNGTSAILDIEPTDLHHRTPLFIGDRQLVEKAEMLMK